MSWLNRVRNVLPFIAKKTETPDNLWHKCTSCGQMIFQKEWDALRSSWPDRPADPLCPYFR